MDTHQADCDIADFERKALSFPIFIQENEASGTFEKSKSTAFLLFERLTHVNH